MLLKKSNTGKIFCISLLFLLVVLIPPTVGQEGNISESDRKTILAAAQEMMNSVPFCALITLDSNGNPHVRTMDPIEPDSNMVVWLGTNERSRKVKEIQNDGRVSLYYADANGKGYVTIEGIAYLVDDEKTKAKKWKKEWEEFYPDKNNFLPIKVIPHRLRIISYEHALQGDPKTWAAHTVEFTQ